MMWAPTNEIEFTFVLIREADVSEKSSADEDKTVCMVRYHPVLNEKSVLVSFGWTNPVSLGVKKLN